MKKKMASNYRWHSGTHRSLRICTQCVEHTQNHHQLQKTTKMKSKVKIGVLLDSHAQIEHRSSAVRVFQIIIIYFFFFLIDIDAAHVRSFILSLPSLLFYFSFDCIIFFGGNNDSSAAYTPHSFAHLMTITTIHTNANLCGRYLEPPKK